MSGRVLNPPPGMARLYDSDGEVVVLDPLGLVVRLETWEVTGDEVGAASLDPPEVSIAARPRTDPWAPRWAVYAMRAIRSVNTGDGLDRDERLRWALVDLASNVDRVAGLTAALEMSPALRRMDIARELLASWGYGIRLYMDPDGGVT